jgi:hypothetical protein
MGPNVFGDRVRKCDAGLSEPFPQSDYIQRLAHANHWLNRNPLLLSSAQRMFS